MQRMDQVAAYQRAGSRQFVGWVGWDPKEMWGRVGQCNFRVVHAGGGFNMGKMAHICRLPWREA